ncbi:methyl-accepting chemotaxis protein [Leptospira wolffii]|uniref:methyl-accepting chemotaxis protein n=1 Tax=Leptospira wolffii TaxID=409998 RepID=UPI00035426FF|nr:methyl-accepting chemotaxis protein [Leptospira wolffii]EPG67568.1 methyl-accepting chemotaxis protein signaling domain protein [Leptospira wolffii serovar Khorat str. Khorat-H2]
MRNINQEIGTFIRNFLILTEALAYLVGIPVAFVFLDYFLELDFMAVPGLPMAIGFVILAGIFTSLLAAKFKLKPLQEYARQFKVGAVDRETVMKAQKSLFRLPILHGVDILIRIFIGGGILVAVIEFLVPVSKTDYYNFFGVIIFASFASGTYFYLITDWLKDNLSRTDLFGSISVDSLVKISLNKALALIFFTIVFVLAIGVSAIVYKLNYESLKKAYIGQMKNAARTLDLLTQGIYEETEVEAGFLVRSKSLPELVAQNKVRDLEIQLLGFAQTQDKFDGIGIWTESEGKFRYLIGTGSLSGNKMEEWITNFQMPSVSEIMALPSSEKSFFSEPVPSVEDKSPVILYIRKFDVQNREPAFLVFALRIGALTDNILASIKIGQTGYPGLMSGKMTFINHVSPELKLKKMKDLPFASAFENAQDNVPIRYIMDDSYKYLIMHTNQKYGFRSFAAIINEEIAEEAMNTAVIMVIFSFFGLFLIGFVIYLILTKSLRPLKESQDLIERMSEGDLTSRLVVLARDEIGEMAISINLFNQRVKGVLQKISDASHSLASSSEEMSNTLRTISDNAQSQAAASEEISASIEEISAGMDSVSHRTKEQVLLLNLLDTEMSELSASVENTSSNLNQTLSQVKEITVEARKGGKSLELTDQSIRKISQSSEQISGVIEIITTISEQIHLLALNAAIEAARAGAAGKGFAVVADEISKLADKTSESIKEIDAIIQANESEIGAGVGNIRDTVLVIGGIIQRIETINTSMSEVASFTSEQLRRNQAVNLKGREVKERSESIQAAIQEQKIAIEEISKTISGINDLTQSNASSTEELSSGSVGLAHLSEDLKRQAEYFHF